MSLKLEDSENLETFLSEADNLWKEVERRRETVPNRAYKDAAIRVIPTSYSDVQCTVHRNHSLSIKQIQSTLRRIYRATECDEKGNAGIGNC